MCKRKSYYQNKQCNCTKKDLEHVKEKAALLSLDTSACVHHISLGLPFFMATLPCYKLMDHSLSKMNQLHFWSQKMSQTILDMLNKEYLCQKMQGFLLLIVDRCQSDCLLHNQWLHFLLVQFEEYMMRLKCVRRSYHSQIEKTGVGWQVHMLDMLHTRSANRTRLERKNIGKSVYFVFGVTALPADFTYTLTALFPSSHV